MTTTEPVLIESALTPELVRSAPTLPELTERLNAAGVDELMNFRSMCYRYCTGYNALSKEERLRRFVLCKQAGLDGVAIRAAVARWLVETKKERSVEAAIRAVR